jgi:hypothetical protein
METAPTGTGAAAPEERVVRDFRQILLAATWTLGLFTGLVVALPAFNLWARILPSPGRYETLGTLIAIIASVSLAVTEVRRNRGTNRWSEADIRPSGQGWVISGIALALLYLAFQNVDLGVWRDFIYVVVYVGVFVLLTFGFVQLAKKAYDFAEDDYQTARRFARMRQETERLRAEAERARRGKKTSAARSDAGEGTRTAAPATDLQQAERRFSKFAVALFAAITALVTGFGILNQAMEALPAIVQHPEAVAALAALLAVSMVGANYTAEFLERNLARHIAGQIRLMDRYLQRRNVADFGGIWLAVGLGLLIIVLAADTVLGGRPTASPVLDLVVSAIEIVAFASLAFGLYRLGVGTLGAGRVAA